MSKLILYETGWTNLVFENKNKEYGAYQLRQESSKTSFSALFLGLLFIATLASVSILISKFQTPVIVEGPTTVIDEPIVVVNFDNRPHTILPEDPQPIAPPEQTATPSITEQLVNPVVVPSDQATQNIAENTDNKPIVDNASTGNGTSVNVLPTTGGGDGDIAPSTGTSNEPVLATALDKLPEFPGGMSKFYTYVGNNFNRPELDTERMLRVYVSFVIEKDGSMTDITVKNDPGYGLGKEAVRVLKSLKTKWTPGILDGKPVRTAYNLPITIKTEIE
ncbi:energy transducer TonB [Flavobacterium piscis]|uniref:Protein TonB n=1 Tax=Flavobacterium piscis TaxID=1114874 RepID=A0ABU1Y5Q7_9FLAO|nr:energy transducer TonB [Flavobacterium piscis]MDR7208871.1 protein TonB [Flavobacterium piscis]